MGSQTGVVALVGFADFQLDLRTGELRRKEQLIKLQPQPAKVLSVLVRRAGEVVTRHELAEQVWGTDTYVDFEQGLNFAIRQIRIVLEDDSDEPRFIDTVPRKGYRFIATVVPIEPVSANTASSVVVEPSGTIAPEKKWFARMGWPAVALLCSLAILSAIPVLVLRFRNGSPAGSAPPIRSLAVLPLLNLSGDPAQEYFADGMTDELTTQLAKINSIRVTSRTSAMGYKRIQKPLSEIAKELQVDAVVEGSIVQSGDKVKLTAQLIDARADRHLWAESYERDLRDIVSLQLEVAQNIAGQIRAQITPREQGRFAQAKPVKPEAFEAYFKGRYFWNKRTQADIKKALSYFQQAVADDPSYAQAYVGLAEGYLASAAYSVLPAQEAYPLAKVAAAKALELDDSLAAAHTPLAIIEAEYDWDLRGSESEFRKAIALNPNDAETHQFYAEDVLEPEGRFAESNREFGLARQLDPSSLMIRASAGFGYYLARQYDMTIKQEQETLELDPSFPKAHQMLGRAYSQKGMYDQAARELQTALSLDQNPAYAADLAEAYALAGNKARARDTLSQFTAQHYIHPYSIALTYVALGENDRAFDWLEKARSEHSWTLIYLKVDPRLDPLRSDPRFQGLVHRIAQW